jgi:uncharacterized membrane protein YeaQ/YmgE (transglycosylase-associated protein family)
MNDQTTLTQDILLALMILGFVGAWYMVYLTNSFAWVGGYAVISLLAAAIGSSITKK